MDLKGYFLKKRFSTGQVVGLLATVFLGVTVVAYATVTIPNNFTAGTTAKANEVNANFQAIADAIPGIKVTGVPDYNNITAAYPTGSQLGTLSVTIPAGGKVLVSATGSVCMNNHILGSTDEVYMKISKTSGAVTGEGSFSVYRIDKAIPTDTDLRSCVPFNTNYVFTEASGGTITYYLNMSVSSPGGMIGEIHQANLMAQYIPNELP